MIPIATCTLAASFCLAGAAVSQTCEPSWDAPWGSGSFQGANSEVLAIESFDPDGPGPGPAVLVAGGRFTNVGGLPASWLVAWDGTAWRALNTSGPLGSGVDALTTASIGAQRRLIVGGSFQSLGGVAANNIARWDGQVFSPLGMGVGGQVTDVLTHDDGSGEALFVCGNFTVAGSAAADHVARWDGSAWSPVGTGLTTGNSPNDFAVNALAFYDDGSGVKLHAAGYLRFVAGQPARSVARLNGGTWEPVPGGVMNAFGFAGYLYDLSVFKGRLYACGEIKSVDTGPAGGIASWDGTVWSSPLGGLQGNATDAYAMDVCDAGEGLTLYVGGDFNSAPGVNTVNCIAGWTGTEWKRAGSSETVYAIGGHDDGTGTRVCYGGEGPFVFGWRDGTPSVFSPGLGEGVYAGAWFQGRLHVGGDFQWASGRPVRSLAVLDGKTWTDFGSNASDPAALQGIAAMEASVVGGESLYIGGNFQSLGQVPVRRIARWDGANWAPLGTGCSSTVNALAECKVGGTPALYAGGAFLDAGPVLVNRVARWDGKDWSPLGTGMSSSVQALCEFDDGSGPRLVAGGFFSKANGITVNRIAVWDGQTWSPMAAGLFATPTVSRAVLCLAPVQTASGMHLYAGGTFRGEGFDYVAEWDGTAWANLGQSGSAYSATVSTMALIGLEGELVIGGDFERIGEAAARNIATWDGAEWSGLGAGVDLGVLSPAAVHRLMAGVGHDLLVLGAFQNAGGLSADNFATLTCEQPSCYPDCDGDTMLTLADFGCFQTAFATGNMYADCNEDGALNLADFGCFQTQFALGCP